MPEELSNPFEDDKSSTTLSVELAQAVLRNLEQTAAAGLALQQENKYLRQDDVAPTFLNRRGAMELLDKDEELFSEFQQGRCGIIYLDVRFLKYINDTFSDPHGDEFLGVLAQRIDKILDHLVRTKRADVKGDERRDDGVNHDIRVRWGGDEFIIIVRKVTQEQLEMVAERLRSEFSVIKARHVSEEEGGVPLAANAVTAHAGAIPSEQRQGKTGKELLNALRKLVAEPHHAAKRAQYDEMWVALVEITDGQIGKRPNENRDIAAMFLEYFCPSFLERLREQPLSG